MVERIIITTLVINAIFWLMNSDESFLYKFSQYLQTNINEQPLKPLFGCLACMASFWGLVASVYFGLDLIQVPAFILAVCGLNIIVEKING
jgi:hypothetical protein